jgi:hypothetical protein
MNIQVSLTGDLAELCISQGRNGVAKTTAVRIWELVGGTLFIQPYTSKGKPQNCWIELTKETMDELAVRYLTERGYTIQKGEQL